MYILFIIISVVIVCLYSTLFYVLCFMYFSFVSYVAIGPEIKLSYLLSYSKTSNAFSPLCIFLPKIHVSVPFSWPYFLAELIEICCGSLFNSILKTSRRTFLKTY